MVTWKKSFLIVVIIIGLIALDSILGLNSQILATRKEVSNMVMSSAISLSGIFLGITGILSAIYWTTSLGGDMRKVFRQFLLVISGLTILEVVAAGIAFLYFLFGYDFLFMPMLFLFFSTIYLMIVSTIMLIWLLVW